MEQYLLTEFLLYAGLKEINIFVVLNGFLHLVQKLVDAVKINAQINHLCKHNVIAKIYYIDL